MLRVQNGGDDPLDSPPGFTGESVEFLIHQRGSLIATAMLLEEHARTAEPGLRPWYTIATTRARMPPPNASCMNGPSSAILTLTRRS